jgi:lysophospholipase L1-like esterase
MNLSAAKFFAKVGLVIISITIGFGICEILSRIIYKIDLPYFTDMNGKREQLQLPDNELGHRNKPNFDGWLVATEFKNRIQTNSDGFRGRHDFLSNKGGKLRIMALGDSFTFGFGVEEDDVFVKKIAAILQDRLSIPVEVLNLGVAGYGTIQEFLLFQKYKYLKPDIVILGFFARDAFAEEGGNDLVDNYRFFHKYIEGKADQNENYLSFTRRSRIFLKKYSNLYRLTELYFGGYFRKKYLPERENLELRRVAWGLTSNYLLRFDAELQNQNIVCFLVWIPFPSTIVSQNHSVADNIAALGLHNIILMDPLEAMKSNPMNYYYSLDSHWNAKGHDLVASLLSKKIIETGMLSKTKDPSKKDKP